MTYWGNSGHQDTSVIRTLLVFSKVSTLHRFHCKSVCQEHVQHISEMIIIAKSRSSMTKAVHTQKWPPVLHTLKRMHTYTAYTEYSSYPHSGYPPHITVFGLHSTPKYIMSTRNACHMYSGTCIIRHPLGNAKQCWISRLLDCGGQFVW